MYSLVYPRSFYHSLHCVGSNCYLQGLSFGEDCKLLVKLKHMLKNMCSKVQLTDVPSRQLSWKVSLATGGSLEGRVGRQVARRKLVWPAYYMDKSLKYGILYK